MPVERGGNVQYTIFNIINPSITVLSPNGGEKWKHGTRHTISWKSTGSTGDHVKIELLKSGSSNRVISSRTDNDGSFSWTILNSQTLGNDYKIKITSTKGYSDTSNSNFRIAS